MDKGKFGKIIIDFANDIDLVFPEYKVFEKGIYTNLRGYLSDISDNDPDNDTDKGVRDNVLSDVYEYCKQLYPKHFFDILYKNEKIFENDIWLLPEINFKCIWESDASQETKSKIWQYLQLILMCITEQMDDSSDFGDATQLFDLLDENEFKKKLAETFEELTQTFSNDLSGGGLDEKLNDMSFNNFDSFNPDKIHEHLSGLMNGKIGCLAKEIAGDTLNDLEIDPSNGNTQQVFESLIKDPSKLMMLMKKIGDKIENKIKSGEINQEELMSEASELFKNMKDMPGFEEMFNKMAKSQMGRKGGKVPSMNAMESILEKNMRASKQRKQMLQRLQEKNALLENRSATPNSANNGNNGNVEAPTQYSDEEIIQSFLEGNMEESKTNGGKGSNNNSNTKPNNNKKKKKKKRV